ELVFERIALRAIADLAGAQDRRDDAGLQIDFADRMALRVGDVQTVIRAKRESLGSRQPRRRSGCGSAECRLKRRSAVAAEAELAGASHTMIRLRFGINPVDGVALPQREVQIAVGRAGDRPWPCDWRPLDWSAFRSLLRFARSCVGFDHPRIQVQ